MCKQNKGWNLNKFSSRNNTSAGVSKWINGVDKLFNVIQRLMNIQFENKDFRKIIDILDDKNTFFYCDPPYIKESRGSFWDYEFEMSDREHEDLAKRLNNIEGKAMISGYDSHRMRELYNGWKFVKFPTKHNNIRKTQVQECIWMNYSTSKNYQKSIFND